MKRILICLTVFILSLLTTLGGVTVSADTVTNPVYNSYEINEDEESVTAPIGFVEKATYDSISMGLEIPLKEPQDIVLKGESIFILDSGNSRIIETDTSFSVKNIYDTFTDKSGEALSFEGARGLDLNLKGEFVVADYVGCRVLIIDKAGKLVNTIERPDAVLKNNEFPFQVSKVKVSADGSVYVTVDSMNLGIFVFTEDGSFDKFVANNPVVATGEVLLNFLYRRFLSTEQIRNRLQATPLKVTNFCLGDNGFLYTVSQNNDNPIQTGMVRCMNYTDSNIINSEIVFGDMEIVSNKTLFKSIDITADGNYVLLDEGKGKVFYYSDNGYLMAVFGGHGDYAGTFTAPVEVRAFGENILVLDATKGSITEFRPTEYMNTYLGAIKLLKERKFDESLEAWKQVNLLNSNSEYAYYGMGLVYDMKGDFENAMKCFKLADNKAAYSNSFKEYRMQWMADNIWIIILAVVLIIAVVVGIKLMFKKLSATNGTAYTAMETKWLFPLYTLRHPIDGFEQFKTRNTASVPLAVGVIVLWFITEMLEKYVTGYIFESGSGDFNPMAVLAGTVGLVAIFVISNWCVASFLEGKGTFKSIFVTVAYSLIPYVLAQLIRLPLTNILVANEAVFITIINVIGLLWSGVLLLGGLYAIHQYSFTKTIVSVLLTLAAMIIIVFVMVIFYSLLQQAYGFIESVYQEITL